MKKQEFLDQKRKNAKREVTNMMDMQRNDIQNYEKEAEDLEKLEAELLQRLQETQKREKDVFGKLETAMIDASIPKKQRVGGMLQQINHKNGSAANIM
jgi:cell division septum initiation protein DivIVA